MALPAFLRAAAGCSSASDGFPSSLCFLHRAHRIVGSVCCSQLRELGKAHAPLLTDMNYTRAGASACSPAVSPCLADRLTPLCSHSCSASNLGLAVAAGAQSHVLVCPYVQ